ncbi:hypothetical protein GH714_028733 [Hevea brasiliensis]|uniref:histone acetyltransferase n=1 Tax=Hevea brasiliensis TaxID=3981 RepID=A0A6A6M173_HEVBR|nr:hypothetical protein GH714_028733 [Hevea brasiliensis]
MGMNAREVIFGVCVLCKKMWYLLQLHAPSCKEPECHIPRCRDLKEHSRRLQQETDARHRASVEGILRQTAADIAVTLGNHFVHIDMVVLEVRLPDREQEVPLGTA